MSFRLEHKLFIKKENLTEFKDYLFKKGVSRIFKTRSVESLYFDNKNKDMYNDSIEGLTPRKKIRVRYYPNSETKNLILEKKISSVEGRFKIGDEIEKSDFKKMKLNGIYDKQYGICFPSIFVTYTRDYFILDDVRITIDNNILYKEFNSNIIKQDKELVVELKSNFIDKLEKFKNLFPFQNIRFSKYCNGFNLIFNV